MGVLTSLAEGLQCPAMSQVLCAGAHVLQLCRAPVSLVTPLLHQLRDNPCVLAGLSASSIKRSSIMSQKNATGNPVLKFAWGAVVILGMIAYGIASLTLQLILGIASIATDV